MKPLVCDKCGRKFKQLTGRQKLAEPRAGDCCQHCNFGHYIAVLDESIPKCEWNESWGKKCEKPATHEVRMEGYEDVPSLACDFHAAIDQYNGFDVRKIEKGNCLHELTKTEENAIVCRVCGQTLIP